MSNTPKVERTEYWIPCTHQLALQQLPTYRHQDSFITPSPGYFKVNPRYYIISSENSTVSLRDKGSFFSPQQNEISYYLTLYFIVDFFFFYNGVLFFPTLLRYDIQHHVKFKVHNVIIGYMYTVQNYYFFFL